MTPSTRILVALVLAVFLALPGLGDDGGENGGGTGVWVLPRATYLTPPVGGAPRATLTVPTTTHCVLGMSDDLGASTATFVDDVSGVPVALPVNGLLLTIPAPLLQSLAGLSMPTATIVVTDAAQLGYVIRVIVNANGTATIRVL